MRLLIVHRLNEILEASKEAVCGKQVLCTLGRQSAGTHKARQGDLQLTSLQRRIATAPDELQRLHDELSLTNAARTELDIVLQVSPLHFGRNHAVHFAQ